MIAAVYERCGKARANGLLRLAINGHLVVFPRDSDDREATVRRLPDYCSIDANSD